jgi:hypothetical protein
MQLGETSAVVHCVIRSMSAAELHALNHAHQLKCQPRERAPYHCTATIYE